MTHSHSSCFLICVYLTLVVAGITLNQNDTGLDPVKIMTSSSTKASNRVKRVKRYDGICSTEACNYTASNILRNMDSSINPCDDFYKFSCGGFVNSTIIPDNELFISTVFINRDTLIEQLRTTIEEESSPNEPRPFRFAKTYYKACMNETAIEKRGLQPLLDNLKKLGGWPVLEGERWNESDFNWIDSVYKFRKYGYSINYFIMFDVTSYYRPNNSRHAIFLNVPSLHFPHRVLTQGFNSDIAQRYYKDMVEIAVLLGADRNQATTELKESLEFEISLAHISSSRQQTLRYSGMTVHQLSIGFPSIPWWKFLNTIIAPISRLTPDELIIVTNSSFLRYFEYLMNTTPKRVLANYALWRAVDESVDFTDIIRQRNLTLYKEGKSKWKKCVKLVSDHLDFSVGSMYFNEGTRMTVSRMVRNIRNEFYKILKNVEWMDNMTRAHALEKAVSMTSYVGYPEEFRNIRKLNELYEKLELNDNDYLGNKLNMTIFETNRLFDMLNKPLNRNEYWRHNLRPTNIGAYYELEKNNIQIPAGITQGIFFNKRRPHYMNYGALGSIIGHEITHGFDNTGIHYDKEGWRVDWWHPETLRRFLNRTQCIMQQYENYRDEDVGMNLNGEHTLREDVADNGGVKIAYYAYKKWVKRNGREERLPGLSYTPKQMFWISYANVWCSKYESRLFRIFIRESTHSPDEFRVNGPLSNMEEFSQDFHCRVGTKMNPERKCSVW